MDRKKVLIGMSGGVDSSVAAYLLQQEGFTCIGATMQLCTSELLGDARGCGSLTGAQDAKRVADLLGIPFHILDAAAHFQDEVVWPFVHAYESGATPNPCMLCNQHLKFTQKHKQIS